MEKNGKKIFLVFFLLGILILVSISEGRDMTEDFIEQNPISDINSIPQSAGYYEDLAEEITTSTSFVKMKEFILTESASDIQYSFESHSTLPSGHSCYIAIDDGSYLDSIYGAIADYTTKNGTLFGNFPIGTKVQLWMRTWTPGLLAYCRNFTINIGYMYFDNAEETTTSTSFVKMKEFILTERANNIQYSFDSHSTLPSGHSCYIAIDDGSYLDSIYGAIADYTTKNGTLLGNFPVGTKVQLWMRTWTPGLLAYCRNFTINTHIIPVAPALSAPINESLIPNLTPTFTWGSVSYASQYQIQIDDNVDFSSTTADSTTESLSYTPSNLGDDIYFWRVRCQDVFGNWGSWSAVWNVEIDTTGPVAPTLSAPSDGSSINNTAPEFTWGSVGDATQYQIQIDDNVDFSSTIVDSTTGSLTYIPSDLDDDVYYWQVRCQDVLENWGLWSAVWNVEIDSTGPVAPVLSAPINESIISDQTPTFTWSSVGDANQYQIQIDNNSDFLSTFADFTSGSLSYIPSDLDNDVYYWRVRCQDVLENWGLWSAVWNIEIDTTAPNLNDFSDISYNEGDTGNEIIWTANDDNPSIYNITLDGSEFDSGTWINGQTFTINIDGLAIGEYTYEITVFDHTDNNASDTVVVTVNKAIDNENPIVSEPDDISYNVGDIGNNIAWVATDANPDYYELYIDGVLIATNDWESGVDIIINVDGLDQGIYNYTIVVFDAYGNSVSDTVEVKVTGSFIPGYELEVMSLVSLFAIILLIKNKKK